MRWRLDRLGRSLQNRIESIGKPETSGCPVDDLTDTKLPCSDNRPINARVVFVHTAHGFHQLRACHGCVRVKIDHHASFVPHGDADCRTDPVAAKFKDLANPVIFLEWLRGFGVDHQTRPKTTNVGVVASFGAMLRIVPRVIAETAASSKMPCL